MNCPHIENDFKINSEFIKLKKCQLIEKFAQDNSLTTTTTTNTNNFYIGDSSNGNKKINCDQDELNSDHGTNSQGHILSSTSIHSNKIWKCFDCESSKENWICLSCGNCGCGRYGSGHALKHFQTHDHEVCISSLNHSVYCYKCDDFVVNETPEIENIRTVLKFDDTDTCSETSSTTTAHSISTTEDSGLSTSPLIKKSNNSYQETASISSNDSGWCEDSSLITSGRKLRPRKRVNSTDNSSIGNRKINRKLSYQSVMKPQKVIGLRNLGNTCFMNSVLQSLSNIQEFSYYIKQLPSLDGDVPEKKQRVYHSRSLKENYSSNDSKVVEELRKILINLNNGGDGHNKAISPECLFLVIWKVVPQFRGHRQHDAHEFLRYMLDRLHTELQHIDINTNIGTSGKSSPTSGKINSINDNSGNYNKGKGSIVTNVFGGTLQSEVRCLICGTESKKLDPFLDLSLDIPERFFKQQDDGNKTKSSPCNISDCLYSFTEEEELTETELYYCNSCKCKQKSTKRFWIRRLPNVLCLHIKRFRWNNFYRTKIDAKIKFPIKSLDMSQYVLNNGPETRKSSQGNNLYDLAAVIVHHGNGSSCGHYTSYAIKENNWLHFNDHHVQQVPSSTVADCKPYILFYIRRDIPSTSVSSCNTSVQTAVINGCSQNNINKTL